MTWNECDARMRAWCESPASFTDDGCEAPTHAALLCAGQVLSGLKNTGHRPPDRLRLDPNGGVSIEYVRPGFEGCFLGTDDFLDWYAVDEEGAVEHLTFYGAKMLTRCKLFV